MNGRREEEHATSIWLYRMFQSCAQFNMTPHSPYLTYVILIFVYYLRSSTGEGKAEDTAPLFLEKFPASLDFLNSVGGRLDCSVYGKPYPEVTWIVGNNESVTTVGNIRQILLNGSLIFPPFKSDQYKQRVHATIYRCVAKSNVGIIVSPKIKIRAVVANDYKSQVYDEYVIEGTTAVFVCQIPSYVVDYVRVTSWFTDDNEIISYHAVPVSRYSVFPTGKLHIRNITMKENRKGYRCQTTHLLSGKSEISESMGRVHVTGTVSSIFPRITHSEIKVISSGPQVQLPCVAQGLPLPTYRWFKEVNETRKALVEIPKYQMFGGTLLLSSTSLNDSGIYVCQVSNSVGTKTTKTELIVTESLSAFMNSTVKMANVEDSTNFTCQTNGGPIQDGIRWYNNGMELDLEDGRYMLSNKGQTLTIPSVSRHDSGMYQCIIRNFKETAQATARLKLGDVAPIIISGFRRQHLQPGPSVHLSCEVSGDPIPTVSWYLDGTQINSTERSIIRTRVNINMNVHSDLTINQVQSEDGGLYQCIASNKAGQSQFSERINVYGVPSVRQMKNVTVVAGQNVSVRCHVFGYPIHSISWEKDGQKISEDDKRTRVTQEGQLKVSFTDQALDNAVYTCTASNRQGQKSSKNIWIKVLVKPKLGKIHVPQVIKQGTEVNAFCGLEEGDSPLTFTWYKDGHTVLLHEGLAVQQASRFSILSIRKANQNFNGMYTCTAKNKAGVGEQNIYIAVQGGPKWVKEIENITIIEGDASKFVCETKGSPKPTITWKKTSGFTDVKLKNDTKYKIENEGILHISNTQILDAGWYACEADNGVATSITSKAYLNVGVPPTIMSANENRNASVKSNLTLKCDVRGDLPMFVEWRKRPDMSYITDNERYKQSNVQFLRRLTSSLKIEEVSETDDGTFICEASNNYGQDMISITISVQGVPDPPSEVRILSLINSSLEIEWRVPSSDGKSPILYYVLEYRKDDELWKHAKEQKIHAIDTLNRAYISVEDGSSYAARMYSVNAIGQSNHAIELFFTVIENGTVIVASNIDSSLTSSTSPSLKALIPWLTASLAIIFSLLFVIIIVFFVVKNKFSPKERRPSTNQESAKILLSSTLRKRQAERDRYGQVVPSMGEDVYKREEMYSNAPKYIYSPSTDYYSEIDISPYATFQLPQSGSIRKSTTELKTFCRFPDGKERELSA